MDWETISKIIGAVGTPGAIIVAGWYVLIRERAKADLERERVRCEVAKERDKVAEDLTMERERHRVEIERMKEIHRLEMQRWIDMAIQNNTIALRSQDIGTRATMVAEKAVEQVVAHPVQQPPSP
jgi:hypothetical protein